MRRITSLKKCPFCKSSMLSWSEYLVDASGNNELFRYSFKCGACMCEGPLTKITRSRKYGIKLAKELWNERK